MTAEPVDNRYGGFHGTCFRCGQFGHRADDPECGWLTKARTPQEHEERIRRITRRFLDSEMTPADRRRKSEYIEHENRLQKGKS
jgi:hypothetical protein